ncbi:MAG TPA: family 16 glycoside hydrolase [Planctomycetota bacterium]|nr:family 16 glycoside hydrolase [Planctomycetota bacterium]
MTLLFVVAALAGGVPQDPEGGDNLSLLVEVLKQTDDVQAQADILRGMREGLGAQTVKMPKGWTELAARLSESPSAEVRALVRDLSARFGDASALEGLVRTLADAKADPAARGKALETLLGVRYAGLAAILLKLVEDPAVRGTAIRALAAFDEPAAPEAILRVYPSLDVSERRDAVNTLASRKAYALELVGAVRRNVVPRSDLTAATIRQLREHRDPTINNWIETEWGRVRATPEAKAREIAELKTMIQAGPKGDPSRGRAIFARTCMQCHTLFEGGGKVGPELTGSNRAELDYLLSNIVDPSAVVGKDYQASAVRTKSGRVISGILRPGDGRSISIVTENDVVVLPKDEVDAVRTSEVSMMPEGLLANLSAQEIRDLIAYLQSPVQVPLPAAGEESIFNGKDLTGWEGDASAWSVEDGAIVGRGPQKKNQFLYYAKEVGDFRLTLEVRLVPDRENSGIQFRSERLPDGHARGYQADIGKGWWGKLYDEHGRGLLVKVDGDAFVKPEEWNTYEIVAVGNRIRTALNGKVCVDFTDPKPVLRGKIALQIHSGGPLEVRFRNIRLEANPAFELKTAR